MGSVAFNSYVDPYGIMNIGQREEPIPSPMDTNLRLSKAWVLADLKPNIVIVGNSKNQTALDPEHPLFQGGKTYNASLPAASIYEIYRYLQHAVSVGNVKQVVLGLDMLMFRANIPEVYGFKEERLLPNETWGDLFLPFFSELASIDTTIYSINHLLNPKWSIHLKNGQRVWDYKAELISQIGHGQIFKDQKKSHIEYLESIKISPQEYDNFRNIVILAYENHIDLKVFISPLHVENLLTIYGEDKWNLFESWKRELVSIMGHEMSYSKVNGSPIMDFANFNEYSREVISNIGDVKNKMLWHWDYFHYKKTLGDIVLNSLMSSDWNDEYLTEQFGVYLTNKNIEQQLLRDSQQRDRLLRKRESQ